MTALAKTTTDLLSEVRAGAQLPDADGRLSSAEILAICTRVLTTDVASVVRASRQERWVVRATDVPLVAGTETYAIPTRALGASIELVQLVDSDGVLYPCPSVTQQDAYLYSQGQRGNLWRGAFGHRFEGDSIVIVPTPDAAATLYSLRITYARTPSKLVQVSECMAITAVSVSKLEGVATPAGWSTPTIDVVQDTPHGDIVAADVTTSASDSTSVTPVGGTAAYSVGQYVCLAGETCVPPLPVAAWPLLVDMSIARVKEILVYSDAPVAAATASATRAAVAGLFAPRERVSQHVVNRHSAMRAGRRW